MPRPSHRPATLRASELRYRRLFESAHDGILIVDPVTRRIIDVNPFLVAFLGYTRREFIGRELHELGLLRDEAANRAAFVELRRTGQIRYENLPLRTKTGRRVDVEFVSNLYREGRRQVIQCNIRDIAARVKSERGLQRAKVRQGLRNAELESLVNQRTAELRRSNAQLEVFVYSIAHDLRAPLRTMQGFAQLLVHDHAAELPLQGRAYANYIDAAAQTMDRLLADLLAFSQIGQQHCELAAVPLARVVQGALSDCEVEIRASGARVEVASSWPLVRGHEGTLRQVLVNLLGNALKFVSSTKPQVRISVEEREGGIARVWVEDNGIGIAEEFQQRIFGVFQRLHTTEYAGTGIGLAIVQKGIERMGGKVGLISTPGKGSRFWFELSVFAPPTPTSS